MRFVPGTIALLSVLLVGYLYSSTVDTARSLSPQGCRMSYMYPSYVLQSEFDVTWTPLAKRYSLWLYREVDGHGQGWEATHVSNGVPVLFIPGNAGSSRQVRSIASSAVRQYYDAPHSVAAEFKTRAAHLKPLDFFAVEFNEDLSAFHGPTLEAQTAYTARAIAYILSLYPSGTSVIVLGHSMGGIVATALLSDSDIGTKIAAILTMSTPHTLPPARFDARVDALYARNAGVLHSDRTPIVSLCGGATDMMIPSEACVLPLPALAHAELPFRRTVFSSALEGAWTGVGHQEMVWCHQVRWRVARAALELGAADTPAGRGLVLDRWLRDGHALPRPLPLPDAHDATALGPPERLPAEMHLVLRQPRGARTYLLPLPAANTNTSAKFVLLVAQGSIGPVGPQKAPPLKVEVFKCGGLGVDEVRCSALEPDVLKLMPSPVLGRPFPIPKEGSDESEGIVLFEAHVPLGGTAKWVGVRMEGGEGAGWITGGFVGDEPFTSSVGTLQLLLGRVSVPLADLGALRASFEFPNLVSNTLVVYRLTPHHRISEKPCADPLLAPLLVHTSHPSETHYFPLTVLPTHRILLHTHAAAPHIRSQNTVPPGLRFIVYSSGSLGCKSDLVGFALSIDWPATLGRWASRYFTVLPTWAIGVVAVILFQAWGSEVNRPTPIPTVPESLASFTGKPLRRLLLCSVALSVVPLPENFYLGNRGEPLFFAIAPLLLLISTGFVCLSWWVLQALIWPLGRLGRTGFRRRREETSVLRSTVISMGLIFLLIFLFVPWQVAFLGFWIIHLYNCAASQVHTAHIASIPDTVAIPLLRREGETTADEPRRPARPPAHIGNNHNHSMHLLLLMTWLLPLAAPVLVVWVRTLAVAGLTTPFDGDHFFLSAAPFLVLVDFASWTNGPLFERQSFERIFPVRWAFAGLAAAAFLVGSRKAYFVFDVAKVAVGLAVFIKIGPRYWGRRSWSPA
ncbi:PGAP1-like protein-domain-containing protein [Mycena albidolilacea]|uniref:GPI inositol-deacylase n=1 Tax=Mycena albidolilacea TaxID=1033008 RepID=A0AAD7AVF6_9AGAR|nr:PGAP1-like protein-domain-containing protein [Mycena albidolilacea]